MQHRKIFHLALCAILTVSLLTACSGGGSPSGDGSSAGSGASATAQGSGNYADTITLVWYPNESAEDYDVAREE